MYDTILAPVDYSPDSAASLREAARLAHALHARLVVLYAEPLQAPAYFAAEQLAEEQQAFKAGQAARLREFTAATLGDESAATEVRFADIEASEAIRLIARDLPHPLIVMGTHGRTGLKHLLYGSTTERVMKGNLPVLAVRTQGEAEGGLAAAPSEQANRLAGILSAPLLSAANEEDPRNLMARAKEARACFAFSPGATSASE